MVGPYAGLASRLATAFRIEHVESRANGRVPSSEVEFLEQIQDEVARHEKKLWMKDQATKLI